MSYLALILAVIIETLLPDGAFERSRAWVNGLSREFEVNAATLGAPRLSPYQWLTPVLMWVLGVYFLHRVLMDFFPVFAGLISVLVMLYGLRFKHFAEVFTSAQLFLNQGDFFRAKELFLNWVKEYDGAEHHIHSANELVYSAIHHGVERALRQYFAIIFWFLALPGPSGLVLYLAVHWSVIRERELWQMQAFAQEHPGLNELWETDRMHAIFSPRFVQYVLEWLPTRLLALTIALVGQFDEVVLAWRTAKAHSRFSNWAPLTAVCLASVGLAGLRDHSDNLDDSAVGALQRFRQLVLKCAVVWLVVAFALAVLGLIPSPDF